MIRTFFRRRRMLREADAVVARFDQVCEDCLDNFRKNCDTSFNQLLALCIQQRHGPPLADVTVEAA